MDVIDMHNHFIAPEVVEFLAREGKHFATKIVERDGPPFLPDPGKGDAPDRRANLERASARGRHGSRGRQRAGSFVRPVPDVPGRRCRRWHSRSRKLTTTRWRLWERAIPNHFVPLASVPMQDPAAAAKELERAAKLGLRGVEIPPKVVERQLDEPDFEVFWSAAETLQMVVCIHPFEAAPAGALSRYFLGNLVGNLYDTGLAAALLIYGGVLERHPNLRVVLYHAGGALPALVGRLDMGYRIVPECRAAIPRPPSSYANQFYFDIIAHSRGMLGHLVKTYGADRFVVGTDYPLPAGLAHPVEEVKALGLELMMTRAKFLAPTRADLLRL